MQAADDVAAATGPPGAVPPRATPDPARCPLCGQPNACACAAAPQAGADAAPCWCQGVHADAAALARVPAPTRGRACLCRRCLTGG